MAGYGEGRYYASTDGLRLFYRDTGPPAHSIDGSAASAPGERSPPVLCLPGLTRNSDDFEDFAALITPSHRLIAVDLRGRGRSQYDPDRRNYHPGRYVEDIWTLLDHLELPRVDVVGTSLGGLMAMLMAHQRAERLGRVVINDVGPELDPAGLARIAAGAAQLPAVADWRHATQAVREATGVSFPDWPASRWEAFARRMYAPATDGSLKPRLDAAVGTAMREGLSGLREDPWRLFQALAPLPVLVVHGEQSDLLTLPILEKMRRARTDLQTVTVPGRGHAPNLDEPEAIAAIRRFLTPA